VASSVFAARLLLSGLEEFSTLAFWITCIVVLPVLALVFYVVRTTKPGRFRLSATVVKLVSINIEVDAHGNPQETAVTMRRPPKQRDFSGVPQDG
jgi:hypothetical protein